MTDQQLRIHVLGRAELTLDGRPPAGLVSAKAAALLVYLAVTGTAQPRSALAGLLWSDLPETTARANLRLVLTKLRRAVPDHLDVTRPAVALVTGAPVWVDALEIGRAGDRLLPAVRLCRGDFLQDFAVPGAPVFDEWAAARRAEIHADMLALMDRAVRQARDRRDAAAGVEVARRMLELERLHEEAHRALMWFLALGGQRSAALAQYDTCRYLLADELGVEPSAATSALREEIAGAGGFTALAPGPPAPGPAPAAPRHPAGDGLPRPLTSLVGRERELARLHELLDDPACRLVTLVGPGGIGKTRLAVAAATARRDRRRDGVAFVSFAGTGPGRPDEAGDLVVAGLARALGVASGVPGEPFDLLAEHLAGRALLLVLDNLEHLRGAGGVLAELLRRAPAVQLLVTSRRQLGVGAEWLVEVPGLPCPPDGDAAVRLFVDRARLLRPGFRTEGVERVCRLVGGLPLAIELAARWVRSADPSAIADRLAHGLELLETTAPDVAPRHRSLRAVIDSSVRLLTDDERRALHRLSVLRGGFDLDAAVAVAAAGLPLLAGLVEQSLVAVGDDGRYGMHELLRQYAADRLAEDPADETGTRRRHAAHYAALPPGPPDAENLRAATEWLTATADPATLDAHLRRIWALYGRIGWFREARAGFAAALTRPDGTPAQRAGWHRLLGEAHQQLGEAEAARHHLERAITLLGGRVPASTAGRLALLATQVLPFRRRSPSDRHRDRAAASFTISEVYWVLEERLAMLPLAYCALHDAERVGDPDLIARTRAGVGMVLGNTGLHRPARRHLAAAVAAAGRTTDPLTTCWVTILGGLHWTGVGDWAAIEAGTARVAALEATPMHRWVDEVALIAAVARYLSGRYDEAATAAAQGMASGRDRRDPVVHLWGLLTLTEIALRVDPQARAAAGPPLTGPPAVAGWLAEAARLLPTAARVDAARVHAATARTALAAGCPAEALRAARAAAALLDRGPSFEPYVLEAYAGVAEVALALRGTEPDASTLSRTAVAGLRRYARTFPIARPRALTCLGHRLWLDGRTGAAVRAWTRAVRAAERLGMPYELARAHHELGHHLAPGRRSPLGLDAAAHLARATAGFTAAGVPGP